MRFRIRKPEAPVEAWTAEDFIMMASDLDALADALRPTDYYAADYCGYLREHFERAAGNLLVKEARSA